MNPFQPLAELPIVGGLFGPDAERRGQERDVQAAYDRMQRQLQAYRPQAQAAHMAGLQARMDAFAPVNSALVAMYGPQAAFNTDALAQNPFSTPLNYAQPGAPPPQSVGMPTRQLTSGPGAGAPGFVGDTYPGGPPAPRSQPGFAPMGPNPFDNAAYR